MDYIRIKTIERILYVLHARGVVHGAQLAVAVARLFSSGQRLRVEDGRKSKGLKARSATSCCIDRTHRLKRRIYRE